MDWAPCDLEFLHGTFYVIFFVRQVNTFIVLRIFQLQLKFNMFNNLIWSHSHDAILILVVIIAGTMFPASKIGTCRGRLKPSGGTMLGRWTKKALTNILTNLLFSGMKIQREEHMCHGNSLSTSP